MFRQILLSTVLIISSASAQWKSVGDANSWKIRDNFVEIKSGAAAVRVTIVADGLVRVQAAKDGVFETDNSVAVVGKDWDTPTVRFDTTGDALSVSTPRLTVKIGKHPLRIHFLDEHGTVVNEDDQADGMAWNGQEVRVWKRMPSDESYYGLGEKAGALDRTGKCFTMWNSDIPGYKPDTDPLYQSVPFFYGMRNGRAYGIFFDNSYRSSFDFGKQSPQQYSFGAMGGEVNYYYFAGPTPERVLSDFTKLVGRMPLPPRWSLGYQQCRWSYYPESRVRTLAATFREKKIPCDVIYLDIDYMEGYRIFTWSRKNFPEPKKMIQDLAKEGFKVVVIVDPGIKSDSSYHAYQSGMRENVFLRYPDGRPFVGKVWPGDCVFPDFSNPVARKWWGSNFSVLTDAGVRGFWNDMNEPSVFDGPGKTVAIDVVHDDNGAHTPHAKNHNTYGMLMTRATYDGIRALRPNERPFVLTRASYAGGQRYAAAWTGDNESRWDNLEMALSMYLGIGISGQPFIGSDIGGFMGMPSGELFARWLELGVFTPLMRAHSVINSPDKEPWAFGGRFESMNRETIDLRYEFLPYIYTVMENSSRTGIPAMRPMFFAYPGDASFAGNADEFMFGDELLVAPVLWPGDTTRSLRLPAGEWYDYWTNRRIVGGKQITVAAPVERLPIFVKAGSTLPTQNVVQFSDENPANPMTLTVYPGANASSRYYEDDGISFDYQRGVYLRREFIQRSDAAGTTLTLTKAEGSYVPSRRLLTIRFVDVGARPTHVKVNDKELGSPSWSYDSTSKVLQVRLNDSIAEQRIRVVR